MKNYEEKLIYKDLENQVKIEFSPKVERYGIDENDLILAELFSSLKSFYDFIERTRKKIGINQPITYSEKGIKDVLKNLNNEQKKALNDEVQLFLWKYKLPQKWKNSLISAILTHTLLIPPIEEEIGLYLPDHLYDLIFLPENKNKKEIDKLELLAYMLTKIEIKKELLSYPAIFFKREVSLNELIKWLRKNWKRLKVYFSLIPKKRSFRIYEDNLFWGQAAWILHKEKGYRWCEIEDFLNDKEKHFKDFISIPNQTEIRKIYEEFVKLLKKIEQPSFKE